MNFFHVPLLQRYVFMELLRVFAGVLSVMTVLLVFVGVFREVSQSGLGPLQVLQILPFVVPSLLPFTIPSTLLLTVCIVYGRIAADLEITATKAAGINVMTMLWPAFFLGGLLSVGSMVMSDQMIPWAVSNIQKRVTMAMEDIFLDMLRANHLVSDPARGYSVTVMGVEGKRLKLPTFQYTPLGSSNTITVQAQEATMDFDIQNQQVILHLVRGHIDIPGQRRVWFEKEERPFPLPSRLPPPKPRHLSIVDIRDKIHGMNEEFHQNRDMQDASTIAALSSGEFVSVFNASHNECRARQELSQKHKNKFRTEVHNRFALSASCFFFVMIGAPYSILQAKRQFFTSFFLCFVPILLIYYPAQLLMMNLCKSSTIEPWYSLWLGNFLLMLFALRHLRRVLKH